MRQSRLRLSNFPFQLPFALPVPSVAVQAPGPHFALANSAAVPGVQRNRHRSSARRYIHDTRTALMLIVGQPVSLGGVIPGKNRTFVSAAQAAPPPACTAALLNGRYFFTEGYLTNATAFPQAVAAFAPAAGIGYLVADDYGN